jgi:phage portal protein BeeE
MNENNFFHRLGDFFSRKQSERIFFNNKSEMIGTRGAVYLDTDIPYRLYNEISELNQVINKGASMFSNGVFKVIDIKSGTQIEDVELMKLLENPNVLESQNEFLKTYWIQYHVYGNSFQYKNKVSLKKYPYSVRNVSPRYIEPMFTGKVLEQTSLDGIIEKYKYTGQGKERFFDTNDIIWTKNADLDNPLVGTSPLKSLRFPLTNTKLAYDYLNIISGERGAIGMISTASPKDSMGAVPKDAKEIQRLEESRLNSYGIGVDNDKARMLFTSAQVTYTPFGYPTRELMLSEQIDQNKLTICDHFNLNANLFSSKNQTYENVKNAMIQAYQDNIQPFADQWTQKFGKELGLDNTKRLILDYSHLSILNNKYEGFDGMVKSLNEAVTGGLISQQQASQIVTNHLGV